MRWRQTAQRARERERERKYSQFINKLSHALPNVRAHSGYIQVPPPLPSTSDLPPNIPCFHILLPFAPCLVSVSRYRTGARRRCALRCGVARCRCTLHCAVVQSRCALRCAGVRRRCALHCTGVRRRCARHCAGVRRRWVLRCRWGAGVRYHWRRTMGAPCRCRWHVAACGYWCCMLVGPRSWSWLWSWWVRSQVWRGAWAGARGVPCAGSSHP